MGELRRVTVRASDAAASRLFYETVFKALPAEAAWSQLALEAAKEGAVTRRLHVGFATGTRAEVDEFWRAGTAAGYRDAGAPGQRPQYAPDYYGSFLLDPDGNSVEAVHLANDRPPGLIDHVWLRVTDLERSSRFYEDLSERTGFVRAWKGDDPPRVGFMADTASFSVVVDGPPSENASIAFAAAAHDSLTDPDGNAILLTHA